VVSELYNKAVLTAENALFMKQKVVTQKSMTFKYWKYRVLRPLLKVYNRILKTGSSQNTPWLSPACIAILDKTLSTQMNGLEYGSGRSTIFFAQRLGNLTSIEHDKSWFDKISKDLQEMGIKNVDYILVPPAQSESKKNLEIRFKKDFDSENQNYQSYYKHVQDYPDEYFDFVIIDGRARVECTQRAIPKIKKGGMLIIDNSERKRYKPIHEMLKDWKSVNTTTGLTDTTIWIKP